MTSDLSTHQSTPGGMSMREKTVWIYLATILAVYTPYFAYIWSLIARQALRGATVFDAFIDAVIIQSLLAALAYLLFAFRQRNEPKDERDAMVEGKAFRAAYWVLISACFILMMTVSVFFVTPLASLAPGGSRESVALLLAQALLFCFVLAEATKYAVLAICYRRAI